MLRQFRIMGVMKASGKKRDWSDTLGLSARKKENLEMDKYLTLNDDQIMKVGFRDYL